MVLGLRGSTQREGDHMLGHDAVAQALVDEGVDTVFGVLGDGNLFIGEALMRLRTRTMARKRKSSIENRLGRESLPVSLDCRIKPIVD